ncbi:putative Vacuolar protein sorting-associated protein [Melia azedarach]|uniref:Vacuolar protein sorting-associated protein n=1 Tax=Melia azedarach TaxID=155640 RepID=A0ACC1X4P6_MELAZ|nr:putative Vacuolar protein sorting-associated protein [Melia azedarach]
MEHLVLASISLDSYPFITICNHGYLGGLESSLLYPIPEWRKVFNLRDRKFRNPKCSSLKKRSETLHASSWKSKSNMVALPFSGSFDYANQFLIDINLCGIRVHFHDSSCIIGTVTLPSSKSSLLVYENLRMRNAGSLSSQLEVSIGVQHICCVLPTEYLAVIMGYFSLPDWSPNSSKNIYSENASSMVYKFEVLDSTLIVPVEKDDHQFLKVEIQQLYCSIIDKCTANNVVMDIPYEYMVPQHKLAETNDCVNIFGRDLVLSFVPLKDDGYGYLNCDQDIGDRNIILISPLNADVWVRIPWECKPTCEGSSASICIMSRIHNCQVIADDCHAIHGFEALLDVIDQFSSVKDESKLFTCDVTHFLQLKRCLRENGSISTVALDTIFTEVKCGVDSLVIKLQYLRRDSGLLKAVAKVNFQFECSASLINEKLIRLDVNFSSLALYSMLNSVMLARCTFDGSTSSVLGICLSKSNHGENELCISLPSLDIWLHFSDWTEVIDLYNSFSQKMEKSTHSTVSSKCSTMATVDPIENCVPTASQSAPPNSRMPTDYAVENVKDTDIFIVRSDNIGITIQIPLWVHEVAVRENGVDEIQEARPKNDLSNIILGQHSKYIKITAHSKHIELFIAGRNAKLKAILEKTSGTLGTYEEASVNSWPFFQIFQVNVESEICGDQMELVRANVYIQCDRLEAWLSHQIICFWHDLVFNNPKAESSQLSLPSIDFKIQLRKISLLISDGRWSCSGHLLEILMRNFLLHTSVTESSMDSSVASELQVKYNNIRKVSWEPFIEPWKFQVIMTRKHEMTALLDSSIVTDIDLTGTAQLNLNITESLVECIFRTVEMIKDGWGVIEPDDQPENQTFSSHVITRNVSGERYAPYILQNLTSLPLTYNVYCGLLGSDEFDVSDMDRKFVQPGDSVPIYLNETLDEQLYRYRPTYSSDRLSEKQVNVAHHFMTIQLDGTSVPSAPISMDLVGLSYFEVDFSNASKPEESERTGDTSKSNMNNEESVNSNLSSGFVVPVVFDVSVQRYSKLIRLYSTVLLSNATSIPLEIRFDIPFGISPKILDPINPGQEFPLPLHLAEAGCMRWRPLGQSYLWSEAHNVSNILSQESKIGYPKSFVCYPSHPSSDPFRCCIWIQDILLTSSGSSKKSLSLQVDNSSKQLAEKHSHLLHDSDYSRKRFVHLVTLSTPFVVNNYLPVAVSLTIETGGITRTALLSEVKTSFHDVDPSHDLGLEFNMHGFRTSVLKFPRAETFSTMAKFSGTKLSLSESLTLDPELSCDPIHVIVEKTMDAFSGARELFILVPFLLYNCTGFPLIISHTIGDKKGSGCTVPCCYDLFDQDLLKGERDGLSLLCADQDSHARAPQIDDQGSSLLKNHIVSTRKNVNPHSGIFLSKPLISSAFPELSLSQSDSSDLGHKVILCSAEKRLCSSSQSDLKESEFINNGHGKVRAFMYGPIPISAASEITVRVSRCVTENMPNYSSSAPFPLVPSSGSTSVVVPQSQSTAAFLISVTASALAGAFAGRTRAITFQPRYVISNACSKDLCYKQKGTDFVIHLGVGQHSHLHWTDATRELLVSVRFNEPGWQWSGSFLPDHLGDTQLKMRNYVSGALNMIRVEVQNADVSIRDEKIVGSLHENSGTNLILLSDDDTGYMPYRIDNFSKERLRVYQQRCETFDTIIHPYTSCPYAWDEPCFPHRLTIEVPGERVVGSYALDDLKECIPVHLQSTAEKPERTLLLSNSADGATKVLSIVDSSYHILKDVKNQSTLQYEEPKKQEQKEEKLVNYRERFSLEIPYVGVSLVNSYPQELLFACAKNITIDLLQNLEQQRLSFEISYLQIDNQLPTTPYPVILSFNQEHRRNLAGKTKDDGGKSKSERVLQVASDSSCEPVLYLSLGKWRKKDIALVSFEHISFRVADFRLELEQEVILGMLEFFRTVSPRFQSTVLPFPDSTLQPVINDLGTVKESSIRDQNFEYGNARRDLLHGTNDPTSNRSQRSSSLLPSVVPIGAPWQQIHLLARRQKKIYVELLDLSPIKFTLSFSSAPWMLRNGVPTSGESLIHRGLMALADVEGARIHLKELTIAHQLASWESIQEILMRHYTRQFLHEMYKVFGSAGVIGNPMGFARSLGLGIRDFLSVPARSLLQSPTGLISGMALGTTSLVSNTVYALSDAATQFSKAAHKGIVAFTFDDQTVARMEKQQKGVASHSKGVINEVLEGLTGLLQSPIKEAEKHGLPGLLSGIAFGVTGLVARPAASILEVTGKTAQSIRNRSRLHHTRSLGYRVRLPRPLSRELPLMPYSWEEAIGTTVLMEADDGLKFKDEVLVMCKALKQAGKFVVITERLVLIVSCSSLVDLGKPEFQGVAVDPEWVIESEIGLDSIIHADTDEETVHIVGSSSDSLSRQNQHQPKRGRGTGTKWWNNPSTPLPLFQTNLELSSKEDATELLQVLLGTIEQGKGRGWGCGYLLHQSSIR